jgi:UDP-N-acetylmuramate dehydrogenase
MKILENVSLAEYTTFRIGGNARFFVVVKNEAEVREVLAFAREKQIQFFILGGGSNILVSDKGFDGLVIKMESKGIKFDQQGNDVIVTAASGEVWDDLVSKTVKENAWGIENLSLIPGTVGAAPVQNIGAYGTEVMHVIESVRAVDQATGNEKIFSNRECNFSYRESIFKKPENRNWIILSVSFRLSKIPKPNLSYKDLREYFKERQNPSLSQIREAVIAIRQSKFPDLTRIGTAGSFWKNPIIEKPHFEKLSATYPGIPSFPASENKVKVPLAWILDNVLKFKGFEMGKAGLYAKQPLVLVATMGSTESDVKMLAKHVSKAVYGATHIEIEPEVQFIGLKPHLC